MSTQQQRLDEIAAQEKALADEKAKLLAASKDADLEMVKKLCKKRIQSNSTAWFISNKRQKEIFNYTNTQADTQSQMSFVQK